jgi:hypothetical protein
MNYTHENRRIFFGPIAGIIESICMQPIDTLKVFKQSNQYINLSYHIKQPKILYKGLTPFTTQMFVKYFLRFTTFELFKSDNNNMYRNFGAGICAGFVESLFITPFELIKTNLQTTVNKSPMVSINQIYNKNGILGLYRGFSTTCIRQSVNQAFNFSIYYKFRNFFIKENEKPNILKIIPVTIISSSIGPILTSPFDTVKTRFMNPKYNYENVLTAVKDIIKTEGVLSLYKGLEFRLLRVCSGQIITFCVIENLYYYTK